MKFYIASTFTNKHIVHLVADKLKQAGWIHTYDWTKNEKATNRLELQSIGQAEKQAVRDADVFLLLLDGGKGSHTEFGMALAWEKKIFVYKGNSPLDTTFYHLPEVCIVEDNLDGFIEQVLEGAGA
ncbi:MULTISPECIES: nucleoside 2-deoxyribosyltransferase [unclassified Bacillus (in: firmicutes)]|uniref:nucleoside 2-deoxyribosyltransferase n=1 Tax=unclassified Bacillus (in: firmicutes) TaxID=185979 RepID=UPI00232D3964|nr:nucleoside 2-deoxyribosyltransferase [Bacillus sp. BP-3]MDC2863419.1 nucleoside 2-deoxyribosyltransferase [Bacillus sp. BP-3]